LHSPRPEKPVGDNGNNNSRSVASSAEMLQEVYWHDTKETAREAVSLSEGNETKRDGMQEVLAPQ
jgi:hypothetical protein